MKTKLTGVNYEKLELTPVNSSLITCGVGSLACFKTLRLMTMINFRNNTASP